MLQYKPKLHADFKDYCAQNNINVADAIVWKIRQMYTETDWETQHTLGEIPLFEDPHVTAALEVNDWIDEYRMLFEQRKKGQGTKYKKETRSRMISFVKNNISYTTSEILEATKLYLRVTDPKFIQFPHYFIKKGVGNNATYNLQNWIEEYRRVKNEAQEAATLRTSHANTMK